MRSVQGKKAVILLILSAIAIGMTSCAQDNPRLEKEIEQQMDDVPEDEHVKFYSKEDIISGEFSEGTENHLTEGVRYNLNSDEIKEWIDFLESKEFVDTAEKADKIAEDYTKYTLYFYDSAGAEAGCFLITTDDHLYNGYGQQLENDGLSGMIDTLLWKYYGNRVDNLDAIGKMEELLGCDRKAAESIEKICHMVGIEGIIDVATASDGADPVLKVTTKEPMDYYLFLEEGVVLQQIRKGSEDGELVYHLIETGESRV